MECMEIFKPLFRISESSDLWKQTLQEHHQKDLKMRKPLSDPSFFYMIPDKRLFSMSGTYFDDLIRAGRRKIKTDFIQNRQTARHKTFFIFTLPILRVSNWFQRRYRRYPTKPTPLPSKASANRRWFILQQLQIDENLLRLDFTQTTWLLLSNIFPHSNHRIDIQNHFQNLHLADENWN